MSFRSFIAKLNRRDIPIFPKFPKFTKIAVISLAIIVGSLLAFHARAADSLLKQTVDGMNAGGDAESYVGSDMYRINTVGAINILTDAQHASPDVLNGVVDASGKLPRWIPGGMLGSATTVIAYAYTTPVASGTQYLAQTLNNFLGTPAYAQNTGGIGFAGLQPLIPVWRAFRNIIYTLSAFAFVVIGIMIMLRVKISPQAVISIQNAIPQLITTLILVTFSYAIAGLIIDLAYLLQGVFLAAIFSGVGKSLTSNLLSSTPLFGSSNFSTLSNLNFGTAFMLAIKNLDILVISAIGGVISGLLVGFLTASGPLGGLIGGGIGFLVVFLLICIFIAFLIIKFIIGLIKCYITLIIKVVIAPLEIGLGAFPNSKMGFSTWIMDVIANIAVFPVSLIFLVLINLIAESASGLWAPSIFLKPAGGVLGVFDFLPFMIAIGGLMLLPKLPEMIPEFIFQIKPSPWGKAIGEGLGGITGPIGRAGERATNYAAEDYFRTGGMDKIKTGWQDFRNIGKKKAPPAPASGGTVPGPGPTPGKTSSGTP